MSDMPDPTAGERAPDCRCPTPNRPTGREPEQLPPWMCLTCAGYACEYADKGQTRCSPSICDCFIATHPDSPRDLHPEAFIVGHAPAEPDAGDAEALADVIARNYTYHPAQIARAILASDWLAARDAAMRKEAGEQIAQGIEAHRRTVLGNLDIRVGLDRAARIARETR